MPEILLSILLLTEFHLFPDYNQILINRVYSWSRGIEGKRLPLENATTKAPETSLLSIS